MRRIAIELARDHLRTGLLSQIVRQTTAHLHEICARIVDDAFDELNLETVRLRVNASHTRAIRCYEQVGFVHEGTLRQATYRAGRLEDQHVMSVLRAEWAERGVESLSVVP